MIIICKTNLLPASFAGTTLALEIGADDLLTGIYEGNLAGGHARGTVDWGDGSVDEVGDFLRLTHLYARPGRYEVRLSDDFASFAYTAMPGEWSGPSPAQLTGFASAARELKAVLRYSFFRCANLTALDLSNASVETLGQAAFRSCLGLAGELRLPSVTDLEGTRKVEVFMNCGDITAIHFAAAHEASVRASPAYLADPTLGTGTGTCVFDLA